MVCTAVAPALQQSAPRSAPLLAWRFDLALLLYGAALLVSWSLSLIPPLSAVYRSVGAPVAGIPLRTTRPIDNIAYYMRAEVLVFQPRDLYKTTHLSLDDGIGADGLNAFTTGRVERAAAVECIRSDPANTARHGDGYEG